MLKIFLYLTGLLPSVIWLLFYLRKDRRPEPNRMVLKVFFFGILSGFVAILIEKGFQATTNSVFLASSFGNGLLTIFLGGALVEETVKFLAAKIGTFHSKDLDEPIDFMLYMIIAALGFAALENTLVLSNFHPVLNVGKAFELMFWRFVSATFLHALCSGILGFYLALGHFHSQKRKFYILFGICSAFLLHGLYNWSIMNINGTGKFLIPLIIIIILSCWVSYGFKKIKRLKSVCNLYL